MDKNKQIIAAVICKNESEYLEEFVRYHLEVIGFDRILIGDNNDENGESYDKLLASYIKEGRVEIHNLRGYTNYQKAWYNSIIAMEDYEWCAFIDADEFLTFTEESGIKSIREFIDKGNPDIKAYLLNWRIYGSNGRMEKGEGGVLERFPEPLPKRIRFHYPFPENFHAKTLLHKSVLKMFEQSPHAVNYKEYYTPSGNRILPMHLPFSPDMDYSIAYIRHYYTKSLEEWVSKKMGKGFADMETPRNVTYPLQDFFIYNTYSENAEKYLAEHGIVY